MNSNKTFVCEITRRSARNLPKKFLVTSRISAGFLPVEVEHCPKTAQFLRNSVSCGSGLALNAHDIVYDKCRSYFKMRLCVIFHTT
jgi:hypothetical protein